MMTCITVVLFPNKGDMRYKYFFKKRTFKFFWLVRCLLWHVASSVLFFFSMSSLHWSDWSAKCKVYHRSDKIMFELSLTVSALRERAVKCHALKHVIPVTTGEVNGVLYSELLLWANLMCLPQSLLWLPPLPYLALPCTGGILAG